MAGRHGKCAGTVSSLLQTLFGKEGTQTGDTTNRTPDAQAARLKDALPDILETYIVTDPGQDQQLELVSVLRLLTHTCKKLPGVFGHGKGNAILPVIGRLIPLFASPIFRGKGTSLLDAFSALLSLLQSADIAAYIQVINDTVHLLEDVLSLASFFSSSSSFTLSTTVSLQVFSGAFEYASKLPREEDRMTAPQFWLNGITVNLSGSHQVLPFAEWAIWLLGHILEKGDHFVAGMIPQSTLVSLGQLMVLGDSQLHKACFQTFKVASLALPAETVPKGDIVLSLLSILSASSNNSELPAFRCLAYDSALAACLAAVVSGADRSLYVYSAQALLEVFPRAIVMTKCQELKVTAGAAFASLLRHCPELSHQIHRAFSLLHLPEMSLILSQMVQDNVESHCIFLQGAGRNALPNTALSHDTKETGVVGKRLSQEIADDKEAVSGVEQGQKSKRRKIVDSGPGSMGMAEQLSTGIGLRGAAPGESTAALPVIEGQNHADQAHGLDETMYMNILETIRGAAPDAIPGRYTEEGALTVLRVMAKAFSRLPGTDCWLAALGCLEKWITYGVSKAQQAALSNPLLALIFEAIEKILPPRKEETKAWVVMSSATVGWNPAEVFELLRLPWGRTLVAGSAPADPLLKMKVRALRLASCLQVGEAADALDEILNLGLADPNARVRAAAVQAVTKVAPGTEETKILEYCRTLSYMRGQRLWHGVKRLPAAEVRAMSYGGFLPLGCRTLATDKDSTVLERVAECIGALECSTTPDSRQRSPCEAMGPFKAMDAFPCLVCCEGRGRHDKPGRGKEGGGGGQLSVVPLSTWSPLLEHLVLDHQQSLPKLQVQVINSLPELLRHGRVDELSSRSELWWQCMQGLPVHPERPVRAAFCGIAASFLSTIAFRGVSVTTPLLSSVTRRGRSDVDIEAQGRQTSMHLLSSLEKHLHACNQACVEAGKKGEHTHHCAEIDKMKGLLVAIKSIATAVPWIPSVEPRCILELIGQLDNEHREVRVAAATALKHASRGECGAAPENEERHARLLFERWKQEIADYLCDRLVTRPKVAEEFAASVLRWPLPSLIRNIITEGMSKQVLAAAGAGVENICEDRQREAMAVLGCLATWKECSVEVLLTEESYMPLAEALLKKDPRVLEVVEEFYVQAANQSKRTILSNSQRGIVKALVLHMDKDTEADKERSAMVVPALQRLAKLCTGSNNLPDFLKTHFPEVLYYMGVMLAETDPFRRERTLRVVGRMMELIGPHIGAFVPNIMVILANGARNSEHVGQALANLLAFVKTLAKRAPNQLQSVAGRIVGAIMPTLISSQKKDADSGLGKQGGVEDNEGGAQHLGAAVLVLSELLVKNRRLLEGQLTKVPLLHDVPELAHINAVLKDARSQLTLRGHFMMACEALGHENLSVRRLGARELYEFLHHRTEAVSFPEDSNGSVDPDGVSQILEALLRCCTEELSSGPQSALIRKAGDREEGHLVRIACAMCLGELGAIDPAKLQLQAQQRPRLGNSDQELVWDLITVQLMKPLRAASGVATQNAARLAVQQLLEMSGCTAALVGRLEPSGRGESDADPPDMEGGRKLWSRFSEDVKAIISPYLTTKFVLNTTMLVAPGPIFNRQESYGRWLYLWIKKLVAQCPNRRGRILHSCQGVVKHDVDIALYILPYCVLNVVCGGSDEALDGVKQEIETVLAEGGVEAEGAWSAAGWDNSGTPGGSKNKEGSSSFTGDEAVEVSTQTIFTLLDSLGQWLDDCKMSIAALRSRKSHLQTTGKGSDTKVEEEIRRQDSKRKRVERLLTAVPVSSRALAWASYRCGARARALRYFETELRSKNKEAGTLNPAAAVSGFFEDKDVSQLLELYSEMEEPDGLIGISKLRGPSCSPDQSLHDQVSIHEQEGNWAQALTCYEQGLDETEFRASAARHGGQLNCLLNMGHLQAMITHVDGLLVRHPEYAREWSARGVQAAWRLGQWDRLDQYITRFEDTEESGSLASSSPEFEVGLARMIQAMKRGEGQTFYGYLREAREGLLAPLAAAAMESYSRAYPILLKLHMLRELSDCGSFGVFGGEGNEDSPSGAEHRSVATLLREWEQRLEVTQPSLGIREPILALRRVVCTTGGLQAEVGASWLQYANMCRKVGHMQTASRAILQARHHKAPLVYMEAAKLNWANKQTHTAIAELEGVLHTHERLLSPKTVEALGFLPAPIHTVNESLGAGGADEKREVAKALLLLTRWVHHTGQKQKQQVLNLYAQVQTLQPEWEKAYFCLARYFDDLYVDAKHRQSQGGEEHVSRAAPRARLPKDDKLMWYTYQVEAIQTYSKALLKGHKYIFQSLPRLLTLWFDFASWLADQSKLSKALLVEQKKVDDVFTQLSRGLPTYKWLTAMPQLVSRICHRSSKGVVEPLKRILVQILQDHPQQALWTMAAVSKSTLETRMKVATQIIQLAKKGLRTNQDITLFEKFPVFIDQMIKLCFLNVDKKVKTLKLASAMTSLPAVMPLEIAMPVQRALTVILPAKGAAGADHNPFHSGWASISSIRDEVEVLQSLQKPKKVVLVGSDGVEYPFLCKPKDDLRKDARMMEFTGMLNRLLTKDAGSRRRNLYIRTFAVIPLTEESGMIEWVPNLKGLRNILQDLYLNSGHFDRLTTNPRIKRAYDASPPNQEAKLLRETILPSFPPIFHTWFLHSFPEPAAWFRARLGYAHTTAVWSMVGHIVGLGDRHGENILFDSCTGDCVHVDFSCLFDKGLALEKPELVPFRLTQNMIDGLGISGYEGVFMRVCDITLSVLRSHRESLMSALETFIHDPLVEWTKSHKSSGVEVQNPHAQRALASIEARLQGVVVGVGAAPSLPLSVEGQVHRLIAEAVSLENLGKMYIWWMPWF